VETSQISDASGAAAAAAAGDPAQGVLDLWKVAFQDPTPWPDQGPRAQDQARHNAIEWIGQHAKDLGTSDPRAAYWTKDYSEGTWNRIAFEIQGLTYPSTRPDPYFSEQDLNWAKEELAGPKTDPPLVGGEILWLERTHTYLDTLAKPFTSNGLKEWAAVSGITNDIKTQVDTTSDAPVQAANKAWSDFARQLIAEVVPEKVQGPAYILNDIYELASTLSEINGKPVEDEFDSTTSNVGNDLADRMKKSQDLLQIQLANTIAADYGKLSTVGSCLQATAEDAPCPFNRADWQLNQDYQAQAEQLITPATKAWAYSVLLPARYTAWSLPVWWRTKVDQSFSGNEGTHPFAGIPDSAQVAVPVYRNIPTYGHTLTRGNPWTLNPGSDAWHVFALGRLDGQGTFFKPWTMQFPAASVTDKLFNAPDEHHPDNLGVDPETFFDRSFKPKPLEHYPDDGSDPPQWCFAYGDPCN
jgi:hypothetical protein